jgi:hypothetical protein
MNLETTSCLQGGAAAPPTKFMVPMRDNEIVEASHEPQCVAAYRRHPTKSLLAAISRLRYQSCL